MRHTVTIDHSTPSTSPGRRPSRRLGTASLLAALMATLMLVTVAPTSSSAETQPASASYEVEFLEMMIDHHAMAVHMGMMCVAEAVHPELKTFCRSIMRTQRAEIHQMQDWLVAWYGIHHPEMVDMSDPAMQELMMSHGQDFEKMFLEQMIVHHAMAVQEGVVCLKEAKHAKLRSLCQSIISTQTREIVQMQVWLCRWYGECDFTNPLDIDTGGGMGGMGGM